MFGYMIASSLKILFIVTVFMFSRSFKSYRSKLTNFRLNDNKTFSDKKKIESEKVTKFDIVEKPNPYDIKRIQFQTKIGLSLEDPRFIINTEINKPSKGSSKNNKIEIVKTGAELRKERKLHKGKDKNLKKKQNVVNDDSSESSRFVLGNGVEGLTPESLLGLVKSTAPYYFSDTIVRDVIDEDSFLMDEDDEDTVNDIQEKPSKQNNVISDLKGNNQDSQTLATDLDTPWEQIFHDSKIMFDNRNRHKQSTIATEEERIQYFKLCIASHFSTVATYVPTDVDSKIRGHCWNDPSPAVIESQYLFLRDAVLNWNPDDVSNKVVFINGDPLSGHDGEWLGTLMGAWGAMLRTGRKRPGNRRNHP